MIKLEKFIQKIKEDISENPDESFKNIFEILTPNTNLFDDFIVLKYRWLSLKDKNHKGLISHENYGITANEIINSFLKKINEFKASLENNVSDGSTVYNSLEDTYELKYSNIHKLEEELKTSRDIINELELEIYNYNDAIEIFGYFDVLAKNGFTLFLAHNIYINKKIIAKEKIGDDLIKNQEKLGLEINNFNSKRILFRLKEVPDETRRKLLEYLKENSEEFGESVKEMILNEKREKINEEHILEYSRLFYEVLKNFKFLLS